MDGAAARNWRYRVEAGIIILAVAACARPAAAMDEPAGPAAVPHQNLRITYQVNSAALPLQSVALWYTADLGRSWSFYGYDQDLASPMEFEAPSEGIYGFFLVIRNGLGESSPDPGPGTEPHQRILVDLAPPLLQAHSIARTGDETSRVYRVRWTAYDANFGARPISLDYARSGPSDWHAMTRQPADAEGYDWGVPDDVHGAVTVRLSATDLAGNVSTTYFSPIQIEPSRPVPVAGGREPAPVPGDPPTTSSDLDPLPGTEPVLGGPDAERVAALLSQARWHQDRGEWNVARQRLSELLTLAPRQPDALSALAQIDYSIGDYSNALRAWTDVLQLRSDDTTALRGRALTEVALRDYEDAVDSLRSILALRPGDAETLLSLGDVLLMMGQRDQARTTWQQARSAAAHDPGLARKAAKRLDLYPVDSP